MPRSSRLTSTFDSATGIATTYTYKPNTNYIQTETSTTSAPSVVNFNNQRPRITDQKCGSSDDLFIDHYSLIIERSADAHGSTRIVTDATGKVVEDMNCDALGNALGFNASTALTTYLYSSMPFDAASGNYYDHARYFDTGTGSFTQADYGYTGSLANPMTDLPYMYGGGDPVNMLDLNGHGFDLPDVMMSVAVSSELVGMGFAAVHAAIGESITPDAAILGFSLTGAPSAVARLLGWMAGTGFSALPAFSSAGAVYPFSKVLFSLSTFSAVISSKLLTLEKASGFSGGVTIGGEILADRRDEVLGLYGFAGAAIGFAGGSGAVSGSIYDGVVWDVPKWTDYAGPFITIGGNVSAGAFGAGVSVFASAKNWRQHGMLTSVTFGAGTGGGISATYYKKLGELGQGAGAVEPFLWAAWPPPYDAMMAMSLGNS